MAMKTPLRTRGVTLVELVMAVVIISIAVTGVLLAYVQTVRSSADPMLDAQALAIAEAYMDEILAKPVAGGGGCIAGVPRPNCAAVSDYYGLNGAPSDQFGTAIAALAAYTVAVEAGTGGNLGIGATPVQVTVTHTATARAIVLRSHKVDF